MGVKMFNYIFLFVWLAYGLFEFIATKKISTDKQSKIHVITLVLWIIIGMLACYQFFIAD